MLLQTTAPQWNPVGEFIFSMAFFFVFVFELQVKLLQLIFLHAASIFLAAAVVVVVERIILNNKTNT